MTAALIRIWAFFLRDIHLLRRDRGGLAVLFVMPVALVLIVCLVQDNLLKISGGTTIKLLLVDHDNADVSTALRAHLEQSGAFSISTVGREYPLHAARRQVADGAFQVGVFIPAGTSNALQQRARQQMVAAFNGRTVAAKPVEVDYFFDPAVHGGLRAAISAMMRQLLAGEQARIRLRLMRQLLPAQIERYVSEQLGPMYAQLLASHPMPIDGAAVAAPLLRARLHPVGSAHAMPTSVEHNVPAWSVFGVFFLVLPLAGMLLHERDSGIFVRLRAAPGWRLEPLLGRLMVFEIIAVIQFLLMIAVGRYILPLLGTDVFRLHGNLAALLVVAAAAGLAACGFGVLLGTVARSAQQAIMIAAVSIVIAAALGGIMVPVFMMPQLMQHISVISPLGWAISACQVLLLRGGSLCDIVPQLTALLACFTLCVLLAWRCAALRHN